MMGVRMGSQTLMAVPRPYVFPLKMGNAFTVFTGEAANKERSVINMYAENLEELVRQGLLFPIEIVPVGTDRATVVDPRIPADYYHS